MGSAGFAEAFDASEDGGSGESLPSGVSTIAWKGGRPSWVSDSPMKIRMRRAVVCGSIVEPFRQVVRL